MGSLLLMGCGGRGASLITDSDFASVVLLCAFDGADAATSATDDSASAHTATFVGNAQIDTAQSKFGGASLLLDGTGDAVTWGDSADWVCAGQYTFEGWFRFPAAIGSGPLANYTIFSQYQGAGTRSWRLAWGSNSDGSTKTMTLTISNDGSTIAHTVASGDLVASLTSDTWHHWAFDRDGSNKIRLYLNGTMVGSKTGATGTNFDSAQAMDIGGAGSGLIAFNGWQDEIRFTKGVARYASDGGYSVPTAAFPRA